MKIIISHDVDHLYAAEHIFKDLQLEKLWVRSLIHWIQKKITFRVFLYRLTILFHNRMNRIDELIEYDKMHHIPSSFFFGMENGLGMSYSRKKAIPYIKKVKEAGLDIGVHGIHYLDALGIKKEHDNFSDISGLDAFGVRNHYVRFDENTFEKMNRAGYLFDSSWFNKKKFETKAPYKIGDMWEFPLYIMDSYVCFPGKAEKAVQDTIAAIEYAQEDDMPYCVMLFHDTGFNEKYEPYLKEWYVRIIDYCEKKHYSFISFRDAIKELENSSCIC